MKKDDHESAKVVGKVDLKKNQDGPSAGGTPDAEDKDVRPAFKAAPQGSLMSDVADTGASTDTLSDKAGAELTGETNDSFGMEEKPLNQGTNAPLTAVTDGPPSTSPAPTLDDKAAVIGGMVSEVVETVGKTSDEVGKYLTHTEFEGNWKKALQKDPYKGTSLNELANHPAQPLTRQRLAECIRGYAVGEEMEELGLKRVSLDFYKRVEISRLMNRDDRVKLIQMAEAKKFTVKQIREEVKKLTRKLVSTDKDLSQTVLKQLVGGRLTEDKDTREFLHDKNRLKAALSSGETAKFLGESEKFREKSAEDHAFLQRFEKILEEIFVEKRLGEAMPEKAHSDDVS